MFSLRLRHTAILISGLVIILIACTKGNDDNNGANNTTNPCASITVAVSGTTTAASAGQSNGSITATATGGSGFTFSKDGTNFQSSGTFANLAPGSYTITAKNSNGCTGTAQFTVGVMNPCSGVTITVTSTSTGATTGQSNGSIVASATGGTAPYTYSRDGGTTFQSSGTFANLAAGNYTIIARDANNCTGSASFTVATINPCAGVTITVTTSITNALQGQSNGSIAASASGGTGPYTYSRDGGASFQASGTFSNLAAGNYTIIARDANNCTGTVTATVGSTNPCAGVTISVTTNVTNAGQNQSNGAITASASGGTAPYTYSINGGTSFQSSGTFGSLAAGSFTITARDANGCTGTANATVGTINPCAGVTVSFTSTVATATPCVSPANGAITLTGSGGTTPYTFSLNSGSFQSSNQFTGLNAGSYSVAARDANGCTSASGTVTVGATAMGTLFTQVRSIVQANCATSGCHSAGSQAGGINFSDNCQIVQQGTRIRVRAVDQHGTGSQMPPPPSSGLSSTQRTTIVNWLNAGGGYQH